MLHVRCSYIYDPHTYMTTSRCVSAICCCVTVYIRIPHRNERPECSPSKSLEPVTLLLIHGQPSCMQRVKVVAYAQACIRALAQGCLATLLSGSHMHYPR